MKYSTQLSTKEGINKTEIEESLFEYIQGFEIALLKKGERVALKSGDCEVGLVILKGNCSLKVNGKTYENLGIREDLFTDMPTAAYIPIKTEFEILSNGAEIALCYAKCQEKADFNLIRPESVERITKGKDNWQRQAHMLIMPGEQSVNLIVGEAINPPGNWSGTPAHKHEVDNPPMESSHEELYYFRCDKEGGFGIERLYSSERGVNELIYLKDSTITFVPWGYHQVVAGPGFILYYLFFLSGKGKSLSGYSDPHQKWLEE